MTFRERFTSIAGQSCQEAVVVRRIIAGEVKDMHEISMLVWITAG